MKLSIPAPQFVAALHVVRAAYQADPSRMERPHLEGVALRVIKSSHRSSALGISLTATDGRVLARYEIDYTDVEVIDPSARTEAFLNRRDVEQLIERLWTDDEDRLVATETPDGVFHAIEAVRHIRVEVTITDDVVTVIEDGAAAPFVVRASPLSKTYPKGHEVGILLRDKWAGVVGGPVVAAPALLALTAELFASVAKALGHVSAGIALVSGDPYATPNDTCETSISPIAFAGARNTPLAPLQVVVMPMKALRPAEIKITDEAWTPQKDDSE